jgi:hypothetical protein
MLGLDDSKPAAGSDDDCDVLADHAVVGRILKEHAAPVGTELTISPVSDPHV